MHYIDVMNKYKPHTKYNHLPILISWEVGIFSFYFPCVLNHYLFHYIDVMNKYKPPYKI